MEIKKKVSEFKSLSKVVQKVEFQNVFLISSEIRRSLKILDHEHKGLKAEISFDGTLFKNYKDYFLAKAELSLKGIPGEAVDDKEIILIKGEYILHYSLKDRKGITKKDIKAFCGMNALYNVWPYWREYVQSMTNRMEVPPFIMPLLKFRASPPKEGKEK